VNRLIARTKVPQERRISFWMDATMSRQPTLDLAMKVQCEMFAAVPRGVAVQFGYFRGHGECRTSQWLRDTTALQRAMTEVTCRSGYTQIGKMLRDVGRANPQEKIHALVFAGDDCEETPENVYAAADAARAVPCFMFQEKGGADPVVEQLVGAIFGNVARITGGAHCVLDAGSAGRLGELLAAVVSYADGGVEALTALGTEGSRLLLPHLKR
jgi:hypothetical protein